MTDLLERYFPYATALLVFGGLVVIGSAAGARFAIGVIADAGCTGTITGEPTPCQLAIMELNQQVRTLLTGGAIALGAGLLGLNYQRQTAGETNPETA